MNYIEIALQRRGGGTLRVHEEALRKTVEARNATAFLAGIFIGNVASAEELVIEKLSREKAERKVPEPVVIHPRKTILAHLKHTSIILSLIATTAIAAATIGWEEGNAVWQDRKIASVEQLKSEGWAPTPPWSKLQFGGNDFNRVNGGMRK